MRRMLEKKYLATKVQLQQLQQLLSGYSSDVASTKKLYWHGISMSLSPTTNIVGHIVNNSSEPINTLAKFKSWIEGIEGGVMFECCGCASISNVIRNVFAIVKTDINSYRLYYVTDTGYTYSVISLEDYIASVNDEVNAIN